MNSTTNVTAGAAALGLICFLALALTGKVDGPTASAAIQWVLVTFIGGAALHGGASVIANAVTPGASDPPAPAPAPAQDARVAKLQMELDALKIGIGK